MITEYRIRHKMGVRNYPTKEAAEAAVAQWREMADGIVMIIESRQCTPWRQVGTPDPRRGDSVVIADWHRDFGGRAGVFVEAVLKLAGGQGHRDYWRVKLDETSRAKTRVHDFVPSAVLRVKADS